MFPGTFNMALGVGGAKGLIPSEHFKAVTYTGAGGTPSITGVGFQPDFVWIKNRDQADTHVITDVVRGVGQTLTSETTAAEVTDADTVTSFDADGFSLGADVKVNTNTEDYVAWCLKAGGAGVSNTDGSITSTVSANTAAGFSVVKYTGNGGTADVGHGLSAKPELIMTKMSAQNSGASSTSQWIVHHDDLQGNTTSDNPWNLYLNGTDIEQDLAAFGAYGAITSSKFRVSRTSSFSAHNNNSNSDYVAYCFHSVPGFSKVGSYTGDGGTNNYVELGFRPAFVMVKRADVAANWIIMDNARDPSNPVVGRLFPNSNSNEVRSTNTVNFNDSGFTAINNFSEINATNGDYIYLAFAA